MNTVRIGIMDEEKEYVETLATYLRRYGEGRWSIAAFTDEDIMHSYLAEGKIDILTGTNQRLLEQIHKEYTKLLILLLSGEKRTLEKTMEKESTHTKTWQTVYRFQSAKVIALALQNIVEQEYHLPQSFKKMVAVYSPIGRCGKTTFAVSIVKKENYGKWVYIGMEEYSSFPSTETNITIEYFIYFVKEREEEKLIDLMEQSKGVIVPGRIFFDMRQITKEDIEWVQQVLQKSFYSGLIFDIGTGVLQNYEILTAFDYIIVPYLLEETAMQKKDNFENALDLLGKRDLKEKMWFLNMEDRQEIQRVIEEILNSR